MVICCNRHYAAMNTMNGRNHPDDNNLFPSGDELLNHHFFPMNDILGNDEDEEFMYLNHLIDSTATERNIYITVNKTNAPDDQSSYSTPMFKLLFDVIHRTRSDTDSTYEARITYHSEPFKHPFRVFASSNEAKALVESMLSNLEIPFTIDRERGQNLLWNELIAAADSSAIERVPLQGYDEVVTKILEAAVRIVREASVSGRRMVEMIITIDKRTVVSHQVFERLISHHDLRVSAALDHDDPELFLQLSNESFRDMLDDISSSNGGQRELNRAFEYRFLPSTETSGLAPVAKSALETLERFKYEEAVNDKTCVICMEEVMIGSQLASMPCSHLFHGDCISQWLHRNDTCPLCRYKLRSH